MAKLFKTAFAYQGTKEQLPDSAQPDGKASFAEGFTEEYTLDYGDADARDIAQSELNGIFHDVTEAIGELQKYGVAVWQADMSPIAKYSLVFHDDKLWQAKKNTSATPAAGADWQQVDIADIVSQIGALDLTDYATKTYVDGAVAGLASTVYVDAGLATKATASVVNAQLAGKVDKTDVVQTSGQSTTKVMSQKAITDAMAGIVAGATPSLSLIGDVDADSPSNGDTLVYNSDTEKWEAGAQSSIQSITAGDNITVDNTDPANPVVSVTGLGSAAFANTGDFATSTQGSKADSALQSDDPATITAPWTFDNKVKIADTEYNTLLNGMLPVESVSNDKTYMGEPVQIAIKKSDSPFFNGTRSDEALIPSFGADGDYYVRRLAGIRAGGDVLNNPLAEAALDAGAELVDGVLRSWIALRVLSRDAEENVTVGDVVLDSSNGISRLKLSGYSLVVEGLATEAQGNKADTAVQPADLPAQVGTLPLTFDIDRIYGSKASPLTGNLGWVKSGADKRVVAKVYHQDSAPPAELSSMTVEDGTYINGALNVIYLSCDMPNAAVTADGYSYVVLQP